MLFIPTFILTMFTIFAGFFFSDIMVGYGSYFFNSSIFILCENIVNIEVEFLSPLLKLFPIIFSISGILTFLFLIIFDSFLSRQFHVYFIKFVTILYKFFYPAGFFNQAYNKFYVNFFYFSYKVSTKIIENGFLQFLGPFGLYDIFYNFGVYSNIYMSYVIFRFLFIVFIAISTIITSLIIFFSLLSNIFIDSAFIIIIFIIFLLECFQIYFFN